MVDAEGLNPSFNPGSSPGWRTMSREPDATDIFRGQTSILNWLQKLGHRVDFSMDPAVTEEIFTADPPGKRFNGQPCPYCCKTLMVGSRRFPTRDHILPRSRGGKLDDGNRLIVCAPCNNDKAAMTLEEFATWLTHRRDPRAAIVWKLVTLRRYSALNMKLDR